MKIGFVAEPYEEKGASGMGYVILEYLRNMPLGPEDSLTIFSTKPIKKEVIPTPHTNILVPKSLIGKFFYFLRLRGEYDFVIYMTPLLPLLVPRRYKVIALCQELASQKTPVEGFRDNALAFVRDHILMPICFKQALKIIAASVATKEDIHQYYNVPDEKVVVIYDGYQDLSKIIPAPESFVADKTPYFFFTGRVKRRKNVHGIVSAFIQLVERTGGDYKLVISGGYGGGYYEAMRKELQDHNLEDRVFFPGYVTIEELVALYKNAVALVFPSFNEGFGMPIVEAMSLGTPVITSNISSTAEVVADAGIAVDPYSIEDISRAMELIATDKNLHQSFVAKGLLRSKDFSWVKAGKELVEVLKTL